MQQESFSQVVIRVPSLLIANFKKKAKSSFPNEAFAFLIGHNENETIFVDDLFYPNNVDMFCRPNSVLVQDKWYKEARQYARATNSRIVGDLHSHPHTKDYAKHRDASPSEQDWIALKNGQIMAICLIQECIDGRLRARTKFWGPMPPVKVKETKGTY